MEFVKHGASSFILHYLGDSETESEILELQQIIEKNEVLVVVVPGDIGDPETSAKVSVTERQSRLPPVSDSLQIVRAGVEAFGRIDVLVSNVGICPFAEFLTMPHSTWERTRQVNLDGSFFIVQGKFVCTPPHPDADKRRSGGQSDEGTNTARRFYHWHFVDFGSRGRRASVVR